jgi:cytidine deaminase
MKKMFELAKENIVNSYAPYSNFRVSAILKLKNGETISGVNIENASYGLSNCAERSALFTAYSQGYRKGDIESILVYTDKDYYVSPCGACRQVMRELMDADASVIFANSKGEMMSLKNLELLPYGFSKEDL